jgi:hypothetical protein
MRPIDIIGVVRVVSRRRKVRHFDTVWSSAAVAQININKDERLVCASTRTLWTLQREERQSDECVFANEAEHKDTHHHT